MTEQPEGQLPSSLMFSPWPMAASYSAQVFLTSNAALETVASPMSSAISGPERSHMLNLTSPRRPTVAKSKGRSLRTLSSQSTSGASNESGSRSISPPLAPGFSDLPEPLFVKASSFESDKLEVLSASTRATSVDDAIFREMNAHSGSVCLPYTMEEIEDTRALSTQSSPLTPQKDYCGNEDGEKLLTHTPSGTSLPSDDAADFSEAGVSMMWQELHMAAGLGLYSDAAGDPDVAYAQALNGTLGVPSLGSLNHRRGKCKPCAFFHKDGCSTGAECVFCHLCGPDVGKQRKQERRRRIIQKKKRLAAEEKQQ